MNAQLPVVADRDNNRAPATRRLALDHLLLRLHPLNRALRQLAQARADRTERLQAEHEAAGISAQHALQLFEEVDGVAAGHPPSVATMTPSQADLSREAELIQAAEQAGITLPLIAMQRACGLSAFETSAVVTCAAPHLSLAYRRLFAFVHDDINRLAPSAELLLRLEGGDPTRQLRQRDALAPHGRLRRLGLLRSPEEPASELQREFALGPGVLNALLRCDEDWAASFADRDAVDTEAPLPLALFPDHAILTDIAAVLRDGMPACIGLWGSAAHGGRAAAAALAQAAGRPLRALSPGNEGAHERYGAAIAVARALDAVMLIDLDAFEPGSAAWQAALAALTAAAGTGVVLVGTKPCHPLDLLQGRAVIDVHLAAPDTAARTAWWRALDPMVTEGATDAIAARYRFSPQQIAAVTRSTRLLHPGAAGEDRARALSGACRAVSMQRAAQFAQVIVPKRRPDELILPPPLHRRVLEVASFFRNMPAVDDDWGFGRMLSGAGTKVLMTGDSGTGKTAAAEVIAGQVAADQLLLKVNLAGVVSKWVGETERNLDAVFTHAEESHAALFFDEADALFAKRGEVERGADRYANLEVGFLLQRLEEFGGLAILASNHKDQLDDAFMRRFHVILHFPRPGIDERRALWKMAIPPEASLDRRVDLAVLEPLDLTGAGIVNAARLAALLAAGEGAEAIGMEHLVAAVVRQFQNEARLLAPAQLGDWAHLAAISP